MVTAIVLIKTHHGLLNEVAETLADMEQVSEVYSVCGNYDAVAVLRVKNNDAIADLVTGKMLKIEGIAQTETMIAFRTYSRHDLESVFSAGF